MSIQFGADSTLQIRAIVRDASNNIVTSTNSFEITVADLARVINGGATPTATQTLAGSVKQSAAEANSAAADIAGVNTKINSLLAKMRTAGIIAL